MGKCVFCKLVSGEIPSKKVYEDESTVAFLDISPVAKGHCQVIPKKHAENLLLADEETIKSTIVAVKKTAELLTKSLGIQSFNVMQNNGKQAGQIVEHLHFHVIPRFEGDGKKFDWSNEKPSQGELEELAKKIRGEE